MRQLLMAAAGSSAAMALSAVPPPGATAIEPPGAAVAGPDLAQAVTLADLRRHLTAFQEIADYNGGNRAAGKPGFDVSVKYVAGQLREAGLLPSVQEFTFPHWRERSAAALAQTAPRTAAYKREHDFLSMVYSGSGDVTAPVTAVDIPSSGAGTSGCEATDFTGFPKWSIALVQRGSCTFQTKASNARAAGASAVLIYNRRGEKGPIAGSVERPQRLPVLGTSNRVGAELVKAARHGGVTVRVRTKTVQGMKRAANVIAETAQGRADNVVLLGAHLDSVAAGPGINDNATGSAALLAVAREIGALGADLRNKVRFAWWGAEEDGLRGSEHYVRSLTGAERSRIALNLNFDMLGSVNGTRGVYDGDRSRGSGTKPPAGSAAIEKLFRDYFASRRLPVTDTPFNGRSDYGPFIAEGIPAGGIATGAEGRKTAAEATAFGGRAGRAYDPCYHAKCDRLRNVDLALLDGNADAVAHVTQRLAASTLPVNGQARAFSARPSAPPEWQGPHLIR
ncbi:M20/M25/M40 family metallo-hydrolase [Actinomadura fibrosa]|uniref:M20/M25/M40 family metallo-hydrolase n=1 Tax=Actinomadura fibrosa TaxID=111802 RepID=A0ABW2XVW8_9ACTN|nr:M20/M25/M40 family metallo-hydrolase [Actinomadura fibrosa]